jgi:hypothetical protein
MPLAALARWPKASIDGPSGSPPQSQAKDAQASTYACGPITPNSGKPFVLRVHPGLHRAGNPNHKAVSIGLIGIGGSFRRAPPTPPGMRVRTGRFEKLRLRERGESESIEVGDVKDHM